MDRPSGFGTRSRSRVLKVRRSERRDDGEEGIRREVAVLPAGDCVVGATSWCELQVAPVLSG